MKILLILSLITMFFSCSRTLNLNVSKSEIKKLDTIYYKFENYKIFDREWVFYEKNICQFSTFIIRKKTFTCTWTEKGDSIHVCFFYQRSIAPIDQTIAIESLK